MNQRFLTLEIKYAGFEDGTMSKKVNVRNLFIALTPKHLLYQ